MHNSQSKEMLVANDENVQYTNKQSREVHVQLPNSSPAIDDDAHDSKNIMEEDQVTHNSSHIEVPEANDDYNHFKAEDHQENHVSTNSTNSKAVLTT